MPPKISIIIPARNRAALLEEALRSALSQSYPCLEILVADNASSDATGEVVRKYSLDGRVKYLRSEELLPMYENWRRALYGQASGEWALVLSDDDYFCDPDYLSKAMKLASEDPGVIMVYANYKTRYEPSGRTEERLRQAPRIAGGEWHFLNYASKGVGYILATTLFKRDAVAGFSFFGRPELLSCDAYDFLRFGLHGRVGFISDPAVVVRAHSGSQTSMASTEARFRGLDFIVSAAAYAAGKGLLPARRAAEWRKRVLKIHLSSMLAETWASGDIFRLWAFFQRVRREYPEALGLFLSPRNFAGLFRRQPSAAPAAAPYRDGAQGGKA